MTRSLDPSLDALVTTARETILDFGDELIDVIHAEEAVYENACRSSVQGWADAGEGIDMLIAHLLAVREERLEGMRRSHLRVVG